MKPYSKATRLRVLAAVDRRTRRREAAEAFEVSTPSIKRGCEPRRGKPAASSRGRARWGLPRARERRWKDGCPNG